MSEGAPVVSVVMPCLNERASVGACVRQAREALERAGIASEVVVGDNGSTDGSQSEAEAAGARVVEVGRRGYGNAVAAAVEASRGGVLLISDSDGTYPLDVAPTFARKALECEGIVLGSRFAGRIMPGAMPFLHRVVGSPATRMLLRVLLGVRSSDPHSGMRAMRRSVFEAVRPRAGGWEFTFEMLVNARRRSIPVQEIPIDYHPRLGTSKLRALPEGWGFFRFMILLSPTFLFVVPGMAAMALGAVILALVAPSDLSVGSVNFGINTLVVGALSTIVGYQVAALGACARAWWAARESGQPGSRLQRLFTLERGIAAGVILLLGGLGVVASVGARWLAADFAALRRSDHGWAIIGLTAAVVGMQTIFSSFFLSLVSQDAPAPRDR